MLGYNTMDKSHNIECLVPTRKTQWNNNPVHHHIVVKQALKPVVLDYQGVASRLHSLVVPKTKLPAQS